MSKFTNAQLRGVLLEESLLYLLRRSGYLTVEKTGSDHTVRDSAAGLCVKGRGEDHQIDAIADFRIQQPFTYPQRLLVEAKCLSPNKNVGLPVVRNAVGVLKDVGEYWVGAGGNQTAKKRFHYQYAIFSATGFSDQAGRYAFAQDVFLIPLADNRFFKPVLEAVRNVNLPSGKKVARQQTLTRLRRSVRTALAAGGNLAESDEVTPCALDEFIRAVQAVGGALLATAGRTFPIFLVPDPKIDITQLGDRVQIRVRINETGGWYIEQANNRQPLFSFDVPQSLFERYASHGDLSPIEALDLKQGSLWEIQAVHIDDQGGVRIILLELDTEWIRTLRKPLAARGGGRRDN